MNGDVGMDTPCEKSWKQGNPVSNTIKDTSTIMPITPNLGKGVTHLSVLLLRRFPFFFLNNLCFNATDTQ